MLRTEGVMEEVNYRDKTHLKFFWSFWYLGSCVFGDNCLDCLATVIIYLK